MWVTPSRRQVDIVVAVVVLALFPSNHFWSSNMAATGKVLVVVALFMLPIVAHGLFPCYFLSLCMLFRRSYCSQRFIHSSKSLQKFWGSVEILFRPNASACVAPGTRPCVQSRLHLFDLNLHSVKVFHVLITTLVALELHCSGPRWQWPVCQMSVTVQ